MAEMPKVSKDFNNRVSKKSLSANIKKFAILTFFVGVGVIFAQGDYGLLKIYRLKTKIKIAEKEVTKLKVKASDLKWETDKLKADSQYIQLYASERFGYAKPEGQVIQFVSSADSTR
jgi:cell division protein FtsB